MLGPEDDTPDLFADLLGDDVRHAEDEYANVAAEMRGLARCARAYYRTLLAGPFEADQAWQLTRDWHHSYWDAQHEALRSSR